MKSPATRILLTYAAIGVVCGVATIANAYLFNALAVAAPWLLGLATALYLLPGVLAQALVRRPGAAALTFLFTGLVQMPFVPTGVMSVTVFIILGVLTELPFAVRGYRLWTAPVFYASAVFVSVVYAAFWLAAYVTPALPTWQIIAIPAVLAATALATTWLARFVAERVARTGVLRGIRLDADRRRSRARTESLPTTPRSA